MPSYRIVFSKTGSLKYISHLDLQRAVARLLIRSGLPVAFSEGFNPHPRLSFALPLSIYQEGENEVMTVRFTEETESSEICKRLNASSFPGMVFKKAELAEKKLRSTAAVYRLEYKTELSAEAFSAAFAGEMKVLKRSKTKETELDIAPMIKLLEVCEKDGLLVCRAELPAQENNYLNPSYISAFFGDVVSVVRTVRECILF